MMKFSLFCNLFLIVNLFCAATAAAQRKDRAEVYAQARIETANGACRDFKPGRAGVLPKPSYPAAARAERVGGTVFLAVKTTEKGAAAAVEVISGQKLLQSAAVDAAKKTKFAPAACDGAPAAVAAVLTYHFVPSAVPGDYFAPARVEDLIDLKNDSPFYDAVTDLIVNHRLAYGFADRKFHPAAPLTRGDLTHALRLTLDLLAARAAAINKQPREINLFFAYNPQKITTVDKIRDLKPNAPFYDSTKTLLLKYDVALIDDANQLQGNRFVTNNELIDWWTTIFGAEAIPVNFSKVEANDPIISRGEFALFLQESLQVLTYKTLP